MTHKRWTAKNRVDIVAEFLYEHRRGRDVVQVRRRRAVAACENPAAVPRQGSWWVAVPPKPFGLHQPRRDLPEIATYYASGRQGGFS